jgi:hypothetical protein
MGRQLQILMLIAGAAASSSGCTTKSEQMLGGRSCKEWNAEHSAQSSEASQQDTKVLSDPRISVMINRDEKSHKMGHLPPGSAIVAMTNVCESHPSFSLDKATSEAAKVLNNRLAEGII